MKKRSGKQKSPASAVDRQAAYKHRMTDAGYRRTAVWRHTESEHIGYLHGAAGGKVSEPPAPLVDEVGYVHGWLRGAGEQTQPIFCTCCQDHLGEGLAADYYELVSGRPYELLCTECEQLVASRLATQ
jgi:hypothetical protein